VPFGYALADRPPYALAASALLLSFVGTGSSFLPLPSFGEARIVLSVIPDEGASITLEV
jgi:hypothetical protein